MIIATTLLITCVKLLLIPAYRSTDFDVHRNWLAVTHSLSTDKWYIDKTSEWTLDYPPLFAWFEYLLSFVATYFDPDMLKVENINYDSDRTVLFQRLSVIATDFIYVYGVYRVCETLPASWKRDVVLPLLLLTNCGLIMLDHIHFQYNGMLYGIMLLSIAFMLEEKYKWSSFWFAFLLNMKHIYIYLAPAYLVFLLRHYCMSNKTSLNMVISSFTVKRALELGSIVIGVTAVSFLPFFYQIGQVLQRLFPFKRGLCHAYWAPNFWALYNFLDKLASILCKFYILFCMIHYLHIFLHILVSKFSIIPPLSSTGSMTGGLVQEFSHTVLPSVPPLATMVLTLVFMAPCLIKLFFMDKNPIHFLRSMVLCGLTSFMFGWHVHEKAILMAILPMTILSVMEPLDAKIFLFLSIVGHYSLFPLLFPPSLLFIKLLLLVLGSSYAFYSLYKIHMSSQCKFTLPLLNLVETLYLMGLAVVFLYENVIHKILGLNSKLPFLPLMFTSVYCSLGVIYCWGKYYLIFLNVNSDVKSFHFVKNKTV